MIINESGKKFGIAKLFLLCLIGFTVGRLAFFPRFLDPFVPSHSDLYRYFTAGLRVWTVNLWLTPRPLMLFVLHLLGVFKSPAVMFFFLSLTSVIFAAVLLFVIQRFGNWKPNAIAILLYSVVIFSLPTSFEIYQLDFGGMLAGVLSLIAIYIWLKYGSTHTNKAFWLSSIVFWLSLEMKPTFAATILFLALLQFGIRRNKVTLLLVCAVLLISVMVVLKDRFLGSPFLGTGRGADIYAVQINPSKNLHALLTYLSGALTRELLPGLVISYYLFWNAFKRSWVVIIVLLALAVSAIMPMVIIPNRTMELYAWYSGMLFCIPFLYIFQANVTTHVASGLLTRANRILVPIGLLITLIALMVSPKLNKSQFYWYLSIDNYNRNVIGSLEQLRNLDNDHYFSSSNGILVAGIHGPYHPFSSRSYIQNRTHLPDSYVLLLRQSEVSWNNTLSDLGKALYTNELNINTFDQFIIYDQSGNIVRILSLKEMKVIPEWRQIPTLVCALDPKLPTWTTKNLEEVAACLDQAGEGLATLELMNHVDTVETTPVLHYYWGHAYQFLGKYSLARKQYRLALDAGENQYFRDALQSLPSK